MPRKKRELMQPLHVVVPAIIRDRIIRKAAAEGVSAAEIVRDLIAAGIEAKGFP